MKQALQKPWAFAFLYLGVSLAAEIFLMVVFRLRVPQDNRVLGPLVLTVPPLLALLLAGFRTLREVAIGFVCLSALTLLCTMIITRITGKSVGLAEPVMSRALAGFIAAVIINSFAAHHTQTNVENKCTNTDSAQL